MKLTFGMGIVANALVAFTVSAQIQQGAKPAVSASSLPPFEFGELSTIRPVTGDWVKAHEYASCFEVYNSNASYCPAYGMDFTGVRTIVHLTLADHKLSSFLIDWKYLDYDTVIASLTAKYGPPCRKDAWCFATGELTVFDHPPFWPGGSGVTISYNDRKNIEIKKPATAKVDF